MDDPIVIDRRTAIPLSEIVFRFSRSGGPGGQNVNKLETKVELLFDVRASSALADGQKERILERAKARIDAGGVLRVSAQESRSQYANREAALRKFASVLAAALAPRKRRVKTSVPRSSREKRLEGKKRRSRTKSLRGRVDP